MVVRVVTVASIKSIWYIYTPNDRGVEQLAARRAHNPKVAGSSPAPATTAPGNDRGLFYWWCIVPFFAYCLQSDEGYHYTGHTGDLDARLLRHHLKTTQYTKRGTNWRVVYGKEFATRAEAMKHEK
jgi:hypothetical protein